MTTASITSSRPEDFFRTHCCSEDGSVAGHPKVIEKGTEAEVTQWLGEETNPNRENSDGYTPVESTNDPVVLKTLLADPRVQIRERTESDAHGPVLSGWTILHDFAQTGNSTCVEIILDSKRLELDSVAIKNPGKPNEQQVTPLSLALGYCRNEVVHLLCKAGVDPRPLLEEAKKRRISPEALAFLDLNSGQLRRLDNNEKTISILQPYADNKVENSAD